LPMPIPDCAIDELVVPVSRPSGVAELGEMVRRAASESRAIYPLGGCTQLHYGCSPIKSGLGLSVRKLDRVMDYPARDMTVTVQAGITIGKLQEVLDTEKQRLPIDVPMPNRATLGGVLATNTSGPRRYGFGTLRDYVIGISAVNDEGQEVKAGGRVVKNVAGYDLCKLFIGSLGTLGIITQATLKLKPQPECQAIVPVGCESSRLENLLEAIHLSPARPVSVDLFNPDDRSYFGHLAPRPLIPWVIVVGFEDNRESVDWQVQQLLKKLYEVKCWTCEPIRGEPCRPAWEFMTEFQARPQAQLTFKANLLPRAVAGFCIMVDSLPQRPLLQAHAGNGIVFGHFGPELTLPHAQAILKELQDTAETAMGNVVVLRCPPAWKRDLPIWGKPRADAWLMRRVKEQLDPKGIFNPGRFVDAI
jgi:glycolate oxidase FAD binding subunit